MEPIEPHKEEWISVGIDDDGTEAFLDASGVIRDIEAPALFKAWVKHVPPAASRTYAEVLRAIEKTKMNLAPPDHVKQVVEVDLGIEMSRTLHLVVCDKEGHTLDVIDFRFPDWASIKPGSIIDKVKEKIHRLFPRESQADARPLKFAQPRALFGNAPVGGLPLSAGDKSRTESKDRPVPGADGREIPSQPAVRRGKLRLEEADLYS